MYLVFVFPKEEYESKYGSRMFLFYVFSWLVEKYKNVTLMLMQFWSEISWMFLFCVFGVGYLKAKKMCILYLFQFKMGVVQFQMAIVQFKMGIVQFKIEKLL